VHERQQVGLRERAQPDLLSLKLHYARLGTQSFNRCLPRQSVSWGTLNGRTETSSSVSVWKP
jgi:hypothetical protein